MYLLKTFWKPNGEPSRLVFTKCIMCMIYIHNRKVRLLLVYLIFIFQFCISIFIYFYNMDIILNSTINTHLKQQISDENCGGLIEEFLQPFENSQICRERKI